MGARSLWHPKKRKKKKKEEKERRKARKATTRPLFAFKLRIEPFQRSDSFRRLRERGEGSLWHPKKTNERQRRVSGGGQSEEDRKTKFGRRGRGVSEFQTLPFWWVSNRSLPQEIFAGYVTWIRARA